MPNKKGKQLVLKKNAQKSNVSVEGRLGRETKRTLPVRRTSQQFFSSFKMAAFDHKELGYGLRVSGRDFLQDVVTSTGAGSTFAGETIVELILHPQMIPQTRLAQWSTMFSRWRLRRITIHYCPSVAYTQAGTLCHYITHDPTTEYSASGVQARRMAYAQFGAADFQVVDYSSTNIHVEVDSKWLYMSTSGEPGDFTPGIYRLIAGATFGQTLTLGALWIDYDIELAAPRIDQFAVSTEDGDYETVTQCTIPSNTIIGDSGILDQRYIPLIRVGTHTIPVEKDRGAIYSALLCQIDTGTGLQCRDELGRTCELYSGTPVFIKFASASIGAADTSSSDTSDQGESNAKSHYATLFTSLVDAVHGVASLMSLPSIIQDGAVSTAMRILSSSIPRLFNSTGGALAANSNLFKINHLRRISSS